MKTMRNVLMLLALLVSVNIVAKPKIRIIATGQRPFQDGRGGTAFP